jgi:hypothetical protein
MLFQRINNLGSRRNSKKKKSHKEKDFRERNIELFKLKKVSSHSNFDMPNSLLSIYATIIGFT